MALEVRPRCLPHRGGSTAAKTKARPSRSGIGARGRRFAGVLNAAALAGMLTVGLAACVAAPENTSPSVGLSAKPQAPGLSTLDPGPPPAFAPGGTATDNLPFFDHTNISVILADADADADADAVGGAQIIDGLAAAGFDKSEMQVSRDTTPTGLQADSIQFSVLFGDECLVGQWGANTGYHSMVAAPLATGRCLVGATSPIDW